MRGFIAAANWKLNKSPSEAEDFFRGWKALEGVHRKSSIVVFPPALCAETVARVAGPSQVQWGGQQASTEKQGAFTGENSIETLSKMGATYLLVGHSERRQLFGETNTDCAKKVLLAQTLGLTPMLCI
ncbi:MAG: triose-phosphate isomerase, partial [Bdellovibrionales bacterium]|nr:triose-phosphate isomerase [Bdellovibrionales bacterium]